MFAFRIKSHIKMYNINRSSFQKVIRLDLWKEKSETGIFSTPHQAPNDQQTENKSERPVDALAVEKGELIAHSQIEIKRC